MKILAHQATNQVIITRLTSVSGYKTAFSTVTGGILALEPLDAEKTNAYNGAMGKTFACYTDGSLDIQEGDMLRDVDSGDKYKVVNGGVSRRTFGIMDYKRVIVELIV